MFKSSFISLFFFMIFSWMIAAINTNQWVPVGYTIIPENPRVLAGLLAIFIIMLATCFLIYLMERIIFVISSKLPLWLSRWSYNGLFLIFSFIIIRFIWSKTAEVIIITGIYEPYLAKFYALGAISQNQLSGILMATFFILLLTSFLSMRRYIV